MNTDSISNFCEAKNRKCRCIAPPMGTPFQTDGIYSWEYGMGCIIVFHGCGTTWCGNEKEFDARFQRLDRNAEQP